MLTQEEGWLKIPMIGFSFSFLSSTNAIGGNKRSVEEDGEVREDEESEEEVWGNEDKGDWGKGVEETEEERGEEEEENEEEEEMGGEEVEKEEDLSLIHIWRCRRRG